MVSPNGATDGHGLNALKAVTCVSVSDCWAVGSYNLANATGSKTLTEHFDGHSWRIVSAPDAAADTNGDELNAVACTASADCWAVGGGAQDTYPGLIEHWDGSRWNLVSSGAAGMIGDLAGVTCPSANDCWAVGSSTAVAGSFIEQWNGSAWTLVRTPDSTSVGGDGNGGGVNSSPRSLDDIACVTGSDCWAVGSTTNRSAYIASLTQHWDGSTWSIVTSPNPAAYDNGLTGIACPSAGSCIAVAALQSGPTALVYRWNGSTWSVTTFPNAPGAVGGSVDAISCLSSSDCWAMGEAAQPTSSDVLSAEHWDGTSWAFDTSVQTPPIPVPSPNSQAARPTLDLAGVTCVTADFCLAVGAYTTPSLSDLTLIEQYGP